MCSPGYRRGRIVSNITHSNLFEFGTKSKILFCNIFYTLLLDEGQWDMRAPSNTVALLLALPTGKITRLVQLLIDLNWCEAAAVKCFLIFHPRFLVGKLDNQVVLTQLSSPSRCKVSTSWESYCEKYVIKRPWANFSPFFSIWLFVGFYKLIISFHFHSVQPTRMYIWQRSRKETVM